MGNLPTISKKKVVDNVPLVDKVEPSTSTGITKKKQLSFSDEELNSDFEVIFGAKEPIRSSEHTTVLSKDLEKKIHYDHSQRKKLFILVSMIVRKNMFFPKKVKEKNQLKRAFLL